MLGDNLCCILSNKSYSALSCMKETKINPGSVTEPLKSLEVITKNK